MDRQVKIARKLAVLVATVACLAPVSSAGAVSDSAGLAAQASATSSDWYRMSLAQGEIEGYLWSAAARVPRYQPLGRVCLSALTVIPPAPGQEDVEASETSICGRLEQPSESVSLIARFGASEGTASVLATVFRPAVRKVVLELVGGGQKVLRTAPRKTKRQGDIGVPQFRYIAHRIDSGVCAKRIATYDYSGALIARENAEPGC
jgi:hypothetical protein